MLTATFPGGTGRWGMRRTSFREGGLPHTLVVIADLSVPLREEELKAWQRLVRVLGHELNNSLAPIKSIAGSLTAMLKRGQRSSDWEDDMRAGLEIIETRADGLGRFMQAYARLAKLPQPTLAPTEVAPLIRRAAALETRLAIAVAGGPDLTANFDAAQIEQVLINLFKNAVEAALEAGGGVRVSWTKQGAPWRSGSKTTDPASPTPPTFLCRSSPPSRAVPASASCFAARSPRTMAARSPCRIATAALTGCLATLRLPV